MATIQSSHDINLPLRVTQNIKCEQSSPNSMFVEVPRAEDIEGKGNILDRNFGDTWDAVRHSNFDRSTVEPVEIEYPNWSRFQYNPDQIMAADGTKLPLLNSNGMGYDRSSNPQGRFLNKRDPGRLYRLEEEFVLPQHKDLRAISKFNHGRRASDQENFCANTSSPGSYKSPCLLKSEINPLLGIGMRNSGTCKYADTPDDAGKFQLNTTFDSTDWDWLFPLHWGDSEKSPMCHYHDLSNQSQPGFTEPRTVAPTLLTNTGLPGKSPAGNDGMDHFDDMLLELSRSSNTPSHPTGCASRYNTMDLPIQYQLNLGDAFMGSHLGTYTAKPKTPQPFLHDDCFFTSNTQLDEFPELSFPIGQSTSAPLGDNAYPDESSTQEEKSNLRDFLLVKWKGEGLSYKEIREKGGFHEAESTLRGRYRTITKPKEKRVRKPEWKEQDVCNP
ncbi:MAG: hypothetical protein M1834_000554 [Cirrosporium novae-zelandiae]|nr:MAG: hypothetical protein M1834_000554 [Cirrosporium novae-zelandiae]